MSNETWFSVGVSIIIGMLVLAAAVSISDQTSAQVSSLSTENVALSNEVANLQSGISNLNGENAALSQQLASAMNEIQSLQSSFSQSQSGVLIRFVVSELMKESISGSSVVATCASAPLTSFIKSQTGVDLSSQIGNLIQSSLLTASFQLSNMSPLSTNTYSATGDTTVKIQLPTPIGGINLPFHADVSVSATVDIYNLSVSNLSCTNVSVGAG